MNIADAIWIEGNPDTDRFAKGGERLTIECYLQDADLGQLVRHHGIGWEKWMWESGSHLGDLLKVEESNDLGAAKQNLRGEIIRVCQ